MGRFLCQMCNTVVEYGDNHPCFSRRRDDIAFTLPRQDEIEEVNANLDETEGQHAETSNDYHSNICEAAQQVTDTSRASTSRGPSVLSTRNTELNAGTPEAVLPDRLVLHEPSFNARNSKRKESTKPNEILRAMPEPSTVHPRSFGPDGQKLYACNLCHYRCNQKIDLLDHYRMHKDVKPNVCDACGKCFANKYYLKDHARIHTDEKPYVCKTCHKRFNQKSALIYHLKLHTGVKPHICETCGKSFIRNADLINHKRRHTGDKPFSCPICGRCFSVQGNCKRHVATRHREKRYKCGKCKETFSSNEQRNRHSREKHQ